jgi:Phycobilisome protein.
MSIVAQVIAQSDAADRFLSSAEIAKLEDFFSKGQVRIRAAQKLAENERGDCPGRQQTVLGQMPQHPQQ